MGGSPLAIGILALQGDVREHRRILEILGARVVEIRQLGDFEGISGLVIPGGESSVIDKLSRIFGLREPLISLIAAGLPVLGTCAGLIFLASDVEDAIEGQQSLGVLDVSVKRNAFGAQRESWEGPIDVEGIDGGALQVAFIRAPQVTRVGPGVRAIAHLFDGSVVGVENDGVIAVAFHPEITGETRLHQRFLERAQGYDRARTAGTADYTGGGFTTGHEGEVA